MSQTFEERRQELMDQFLTDNDTLIWVKNAKVFFFWVEELGTWAVKSQEQLREEFKALTQDDWLAALATQDPTLIITAARFQQDTSLTWMVNRVKNERNQNLDALRLTAEEVFSDAILVDEDEGLEETAEETVETTVEHNNNPYGY